MIKNKLFQNARSRALVYGSKGYTRLRDRWVKLMTFLTKRMSFRQLKISLIVCACLAVSYSCWIIISGLMNETTFSLPTENIRQPRYVTTPVLEEQMQSSQLPQKDRDRLQKFVNYMDSLTTTPTGQFTYDSINQARPGLLDSVRQLLKL